MLQDTQIRLFCKVRGCWLAEKWLELQNPLKIFGYSPLDPTKKFSNFLRAYWPKLRFSRSWFATASLHHCWHIRQGNFDEQL